MSDRPVAAAVVPALVPVPGPLARPSVPALGALLPDLGQVRLDQPLGQLLGQVAALAAGTLTSVDGVCLALVEKGRAGPVAAFTCPVAAALDERQYAPGAGPGLQAARTGTTIRLDMTGAPPVAFPELVALGHHHGVRDVIAVGIPTTRHVRGALTLYATTTPISDHDIATAQAFVAHATTTLANATLYDASTRLAARLGQALLSRAVIEQAKGVLMGRHGLDAETAFQRLSRASRHSNTKLGDLATDLVTSTSSPTGEGSPHRE